MNALPAEQGELMTLPDQCAATLTAVGAEQALDAACQAASVDSRDAVLMRIGENALFHLPRAALVARIARSESLLANVGKEVAVARWLEDADFPAARVWHGAQEPIVAAGRVVTFWIFVADNGQAPSEPRCMSVSSTMLKRQLNQHVTGYPVSVERHE